MVDEENITDADQSFDLQVYTLLSSDKTDDFNLQLITVGDKKFIFDRVESLRLPHDDSDAVSYLYHLKLTGEPELCSSITAFSLRLSTAGKMIKRHH
ncbi:unnamed protein product [Didymodactylos carnosus]|uniref:Uncharacterized protein n=1 Tax=Didymodactylos carnosus TaxID=1234261 RepID=A0A814MGD1_9BILA|nr:unnamed protein product [Didymodactylos carnosus]CAF1671354.1 unnamed protein product [Didymodactylos carnosus]CAF3845428.1 unnamed protein product [Didymodactylos carnosus]CAF4546248.1 unnamed protein product [Didymodactylos carnosus]